MWSFWGSLETMGWSHSKHLHSVEIVRVIFPTRVQCKRVEEYVNWVLLIGLWYCLVAKSLFATPWIVAHQAPLSMVFPRQEYWEGDVISFSRDLPNPEIKSTSAGRFFTTEPSGKPSHGPGAIILAKCLILTTASRYRHHYEWASRGVHLPMQEMWVQSLGWEDPLEEEMATHFSISAWKIPWTEGPGRL